MKIPSLFRMPQHKRFNFEPHYYDPVKEDIKNRMARIRSELSEEALKTQRRSIHEGFQRREKQDRRVDMMQWILIILMLGTILGWLYFGNVAFYIFLVLFPLYVWFRIRKPSQS
jgi:hypothetical protein